VVFPSLFQCGAPSLCPLPLWERAALRAATNSFG
jgi:hypothetical protein